MQNAITTIISTVKRVLKTIIDFIKSFFAKETLASAITPEKKVNVVIKTTKPVNRGRKGRGVEGRTYKSSLKGKKGRSWTDAEKAHMSALQKGSEHKNYGRQVIQYNKTTCEEIHRFRSVATAARSTKICYASIYSSCTLKTATAGGFIFMYA